jgi:hypothetical protein
MHFAKHFQVSLREKGKEISCESCEIRFPRSGGGHRSGKRMLLVTIMI